MSRTWEDILGTMLVRRRQDATLIRRMNDIKTRYNGDTAIPMPTVPNYPDMPALMPQLIYDGIEHTSMRAASTAPMIDCPALNPNKETGVRSIDYAGRRRRVWYGRWYENSLRLKTRRWYRHLVGYGTFAMVVLPDYERDGVCIEVRDPLATYPELRSNDDIRDPTNVGFVFGKSADWLKKNYPNSVDLLNASSPNSRRASPDEALWDVVEWIDGEEIVLGVLGQRSEVLESTRDHFGSGLELSRMPNRAGVVPAVVPRRITLDLLAGQLNHIIPMVDWGSRLMALDIIAAEKGTFPDTVIFGEGSAQPILAGNEWVDGRTGGVNIITNAKDVRNMNAQPGQASQMMIDRLERAGRLSGGVLSQYGGEMNGAIRSGRVMDSMAAMSVDPRVQELQEIMSAALTQLNVAIAQVEKGYFPNKKMTIFSGWPGERGLVEYTPAQLWETDANVVSYASPGLDISQQTVSTSQMVGAGLMSKATGRRHLPVIEDADAEERQILVEGLDDSIFMGAREKIARGELPLIDAVAIREGLQRGDNVAVAVRAADDAARARQAAEAPPPMEMAPGLEMPGMGAEAGAMGGQPPPEMFDMMRKGASIQPPPSGLNNLQSLFMALRQPREPVG